MNQSGRAQVDADCPECALALAEESFASEQRTARQVRLVDHPGMRAHIRRFLSVPFRLTAQTRAKCPLDCSQGRRSNAPILDRVPRFARFRAGCADILHEDWQDDTVAR